MSRFVLRPAALAVALILSGFPVAAQTQNVQSRVISISGESSGAAAPDLATVSVGVVTEAKTAQEALAQNAARMTAVFEALTAAGIEDKDIRTSRFNLRPLYDEVRISSNALKRELSGYEAANGISVRLRDVSKVGPTLDLLVGAGANHSAGVSFSVRDREEVLKQARREAALNARAKAQEYAKIFGVTLGALTRVSESVYEERGEARRAELAMVTTPIAGGEQTIKVRVDTVWEIID